MKDEAEMNEMAGDMKDLLVQTGKVGPSLVDLPGVGERMLYRLYKAGVTNAELLAAENPIDLAVKVNIKDDAAVKLVKAARAAVAADKAKGY